MRVLVTDDSETDRKLLRVNLEAKGLEVHEVFDGREALEWLQTNPVEILVTDALMPRMDGFRLCVEVRRDPKLRNIGIIFYTGTYTSQSDERLAFQCGADRFFKKPDEIQKLVSEVEIVAGEERSSLGEPARETTEDLTILREYSEVLVAKLEQNTLALEQTREQLLHKHRALMTRSEELARAESQLRTANEDLEERVRERTGQLEAANRELESFTHAVSHDLRTPIRVIEGFVAILMAECKTELTETCRSYLDRLPTATQRMKQLIDDLLQLSRVTHADLDRQPVNLSKLAENVFEELRRKEPERAVKVKIQPGVIAEGDPSLLGIVLENLFGNAWKFTGRNPDAVIEFGLMESGERIFFVRDNGVGFEMEQSEKLFGAFQRLHPEGDFPGTGVGLSTVQRIVTRHGGRIWAESFPGERTTFYFTL